MRPTNKQLAMRDPALAIMLGALATPGSDFGTEFGRARTKFGDDYGADSVPTPENMQRAWNQHIDKMNKGSTRSRELVLEPNMDSESKIQRYTFAANQDLTLGVAVPVNAGQNPETHIRPQRVTVNTPFGFAGFGTLSSIKVANVGVIVGGVKDMSDFAATAFDTHLDVPTLSPANRVVATGNYSGRTPPGYAPASLFTLCISYTGPASMVA